MSGLNPLITPTVKQYCNVTLVRHNPIDMSVYGGGGGGVGGMPTQEYFELHGLGGAYQYRYQFINSYTIHLLTIIRTLTLNGLSQ